MNEIIQFCQSIFNPLVDLTRFSAIALIVWYGGGKTIKETFTLGMLVVFLYYMRMFFRPIQDLTEKYNIIQGGEKTGKSFLNYLLFNAYVMGDTFIENFPPDFTGFNDARVKIVYHSITDWTYDLPKKNEGDPLH